MSSTSKPPGCPDRRPARQPPPDPARPGPERPDTKASSPGSPTSTTTGRCGRSPPGRVRTPRLSAKSCARTRPSADEVRRALDIARHWHTEPRTQESQETEVCADDRPLLHHHVPRPVPRRRRLRQGRHDRATVDPTTRSPPTTSRASCAPPPRSFSAARGIPPSARSSAPRAPRPHGRGPCRRRSGKPDWTISRRHRVTIDERAPIRRRRTTWSWASRPGRPRHASPSPGLA